MIITILLYIVTRCKIVISMAGEHKKKPKVVDHFECPYCGERIHYEAGDEILKPSVKADKKPYKVIEKDTQHSLEEDYQKSLEKGKGGRSSGRKSTRSRTSR